MSEHASQTVNHSADSGTRYANVAAMLAEVGATAEWVGKIVRIGLAAPAATDPRFRCVYQVGGVPTWEPLYGHIKYRVSAFPLDGNPRTDTVFTVPADPTGAGRFLLKRALIRLSTALTGAGSLITRVGSTSGGQEVILDTAAITNATPVGILGGETVASLGADMAAANNYAKVYAAGQGFFVRLTPTGEVTGGAVTVYLDGDWLP